MATLVDGLVSMRAIPRNPMNGGIVANAMIYRRRFFRFDVTYYYVSSAAADGAENGANQSNDDEDHDAGHTPRDGIQDHL